MKTKTIRFYDKENGYLDLNKFANSDPVGFSNNKLDYIGVDIDKSHYVVSVEIGSGFKVDEEITKNSSIIYLLKDYDENTGKAVLEVICDSGLVDKVISLVRQKVIEMETKNVPDDEDYYLMMTEEFDR